MRGLRVALIALAAVVLACLLLAGTGAAVAASSPEGRTAATAILARTGPAPAPAADREAVLGAWEAAGARLDGVRSHLAANAAPGALDPAVLLFADLCGADLPLDGDLEPGDLLLYRGVAPAAGPRWRLGMVTGWATAVILDPRAHLLEEVVRARLVDDPPPVDEPPLADAGSVRACRLSPALLPAGTAAAVTAHRHVALVDAGAAVPALQWELDHPRDADTGALHRLGRIALTPMVLVSRGSAALLGGTGRLATWLFETIGPPGPWGLLGATFDGRRLHAVLTEGFLTDALGPLPLLLRSLPAGAALVAPLQATSSFAVGVLTGVENSPRVPVGGVLLSLACDAMVFAKPLAAGSAALRRVLDASARAGDLASARPSTVLRLLGTFPRRRVHDLVDTVSLVVRPSSLPTHLLELSGRLAHWGRTTTAPEAASSAMDRILAAALRHLHDTDELHHIEHLADLSHLHSGARTLAAAATGQLPSLPTAPPPPPIHLPLPTADPRLPH